MEFVQDNVRKDYGKIAFYRRIYYVVISDGKKARITKSAA